MKINEKINLKKTCNYFVGLFSSVESVATKGKLPLSVISYPYPQSVTLFLKNSKHANFINTIAKAFKRKSYTSSVISYTSPTISYTNPQLVTLLAKNSKYTNFKKLVAIGFNKISYTSPTISYTSPTISYTNPQLVTLYPQLVTFCPPLVTLLPTISYTCPSRTTATTVKTGLLLKLLQNYKNLV